MDIQPFAINIPQSVLDDLQERLARTYWPNELPDVGWTYGVPASYVRRLVDYWRDGYNWRKWEARINAYPQFITEIDGQKIHFLHVCSLEANALPVIVTHGWPGSIVEYLDIIGPLTDPGAYRGDPADAFHLVIPSLPGFGFSGSTHETGWSPARISKAWIELMHGLGYDRYGAIGNDWGSYVSPEVGRFDPAHVVGVHVTQIYIDPTPAEIPTLPSEAMPALEGLRWFHENMSAYHTFQSQQPQTIAYALTDSPAGWLGWICQIFRDGIDDEFILTNATLYWVTETIASAARIYYENAHAVPPTEPTITPIGLATFRDDSHAFRTLAERAHKNIVQWTEYDQGNHYAAHTVPNLWVNDVQKFFRTLR